MLSQIPAAKMGTCARLYLTKASNPSFEEGGEMEPDLAWNNHPQGEVVTAESSTQAKGYQRSWQWPRVKAAV